MANDAIAVPFKHQQDEFEAHGLDEVRGIFWEQGCGKTKAVIDSLAALHDNGEVDGLLVLAPNGVHRNWVSDELPKWLPASQWKNTRCHVWWSGKATNKGHQKSFERVLEHPGLAVLVMSYDAMMTERKKTRDPYKGKDAAKAFLERRRALYVLDESPRIKNPTAKRTKRVLGSRDHARYRRILTGTPVANSPFDLYSQLRFLDPDIWKPMGLGSFAAFKTYFGIWEQRNLPGGGTFPHCVAFKNLDKLAEVVQSVGSRVTKDEALDLPPKLYSKQYVELTPKQRELYAQLRDDFAAELDSGELVSAPLAIVRLLRLQQVACGYIPPDGIIVEDVDGREITNRLVDIEGGNPRLNLLGDICEDLGHKAIIWCRFRRDIDLVTERLGEAAVRYDGIVGDDQRAANIDAFQNGDAQFLVANPACLSEGVTLHAARTVIYYSNSFNLTQRLQSEDRAHRIGQHHPVNYIDLIAQETVDEQIVDALRNKLDIASQITGDEIRTWL